MIVGGLGVGLVNPPLASTAVGVVEPQRAGMASGINSTFRQVGIATGIALLGTCSPTRCADEVTAMVSAVPGLSGQGRADRRRGAVRGRSAAAQPPARPVRAQVGGLTKAAFTPGLNRDPAGGRHHRAGVRRGRTGRRSGPGTSPSSRARRRRLTIGRPRRPGTSPPALPTVTACASTSSWASRGVARARRAPCSQRPRSCAHLRRGHLPVERAAPHQARCAGAAHHGGR